MICCVAANAPLDRAENAQMLIQRLDTTHPDDEAPRRGRWLLVKICQQVREAMPCDVGAVLQRSCAMVTVAMAVDVDEELTVTQWRFADKGPPLRSKIRVKWTTV